MNRKSDVLQPTSGMHAGSCQLLGIVAYQKPRSLSDVGPGYDGFSVAPRQTISGPNSVPDVSGLQRAALSSYILLAT